MEPSAGGEEEPPTADQCPEGNGADPVLAADTPENHRGDRAMEEGLQAEDPAVTEAALASLRADAGGEITHPWMAYAEGRLLQELGRTAEADAAYRRALAAHPRFDRAHLQLGGLASDAGDRAGAVREWRLALRANPTLIIAWYNVGLTQYLEGAYEEALFAWSCGLEREPDDWQLRTKVVQALLALDRFADARELRADLRRRYEAGQAPERTTSMLIDQFVVGGHRVFVRETLTWDDEMQYVYVFYVTKNDRTLRTLQLETSGALRSLGADSLMGMDEGNTHSQLGVNFDERPTYEELRPIARDLVERVQAGAATIPISSTRR